VHYQHANGIGDDTLDYSNNVHKSISASTTFMTDTNDFEEIKIMLLKLTNEVVERIKYEEQVTKTIGVQIKLPNFRLLSRSITLTRYIDNSEEIFVNIMTLYEKHFINKNIRLIGVSLSNLKFKNDESLLMNSELYDDYIHHDGATKDNRDSLFELVEKINNKYSRNIITIASNKLTK
jgi:DNA polymerase-4